MGIEGYSPETVTLDAGEWRRYQEYVEGLERQQTADGIELKHLRPLVERLEREEAERQRIADLPAVSRFSWSKIAMLSVAGILTVANIFLMVQFIRLAFVTSFIWVFVALTAVSLVVAARAFLTRSLIAPLVFTVTVIVAFAIVNSMAAAAPVSDDKFSLSVSQADGQSSSEWSVVILDPTGGERFRQPVEAGKTHFEYPIAGLAEGETIVAQTTVPGTKCSLSLGRLTVAQTVYADPGPLDCRYTVPVAPRPLLSRRHRLLWRSQLPLHRSRKSRSKCQPPRRPLSNNPLRLSLHRRLLRRASATRTAPTYGTVRAVPFSLMSQASSPSSTGTTTAWDATRGLSPRGCSLG